VTGTVTSVTDFGLFLELEEGIEGLVHVSEISGDKRGNPMSRFQVDDVIQAKVLNVSREEKKIGLSIRKLEEGSDKEILKNYLNSQEEATSSLGDLLRQEMVNLKQQTLFEGDQSAELQSAGSKSKIQKNEYKGFSESGQSGKPDAD
jgi:small subunit ribosomal protein S1